MYILQSTLILFVTDQETPCIEPFARITMRGDEKVQNMFWLFPIIFMFHEMEEIIGLRIWLDKNRDIVRKYNKVSMLYQNFSNEGFSIAVLEEYLLCIIITCISIFFKTYIVWVVIAHRLSTVTYISLKRYQNKKSSRSSKFVANLYYFKVIITNSLGISNLVIMLAIRVIHVAADILV